MAARTAAGAADLITETIHMKPKTFEFEGENLTITEIRKRVPAFSDQTIRKHLEAGRNTTQAMLTHRQVYRKPTGSQQFVIGKPDPKRKGICP